MKKSSFVELEGKEKRRPIQYLDIKVTTEGKGRADQVIEELLEKVDISSCMNDHYDSIVLSSLLVKLQLDYNIPLEGISFLLRPIDFLFLRIGVGFH